MTQLSKYGGQTISAPGSTIKKKDNNQKVVWGIPKSDPFKTFVNNTQTTTKSSTAPVAPITRSGGSSYNPTSNNPTAGNITPASPGATGIGQGSNAPATSAPGGSTNILSSAGKDYAKNWMDNKYGGGNSQTTTVTPPGPTTTPDNTKDDKGVETKDESAYLKYLRGQFNPDEAKRAQENVNALNKRTADEIAANRKEQDRIQENEAGMVERGQTHLSTSANRESSKALADLAIAKGYSTDILNQYTDAGATLYEAEQAAAEESNKALTLEEAQTLGVPFGTTMGQARLMGIIPTSGAADGFSLSEGQARYDAQGNLIAERGKTYAPGSTTSGSTASAGGNAIVDANGKQIKLTATQVDTISGYENTVQGAARAMALLDTGVSTGPLSGRLLQASKFAGGGNEDQMKLEQLLGKIKADFMKAVSGAAVSEQETVRLSAFLPAITDQENVIKSKLNTLMSETESSKANFLKTLGAQETSTQESISDQPTQMRLPNGTIVYRQEDGTYSE